MSLDKKNLMRHKFNRIQESSSSEDDEDAQLLTEELEKSFFKLLSQLKKKHTKIYDKKVNFFPVKISESDAQANNCQNENKKEEELKMDYKTWLKGQKDRVEDDIKEDFEGLHEFWANPKLNKNEKFLRDYVLNKKFLDADDLFNVEEEIRRLSDEEKEIQKEIEFEHNYNYRFENENEDLGEQSTEKKLRKEKKRAKGEQGKPSKGKRKRMGEGELSTVESPEKKVHDSPELKANQVMEEKSDINGMEKIGEAFMKENQRTGVSEVVDKRIVTEKYDARGGEKRKIYSNSVSKENNSTQNVGFTTSLKKKKRNDAAVELKDQKCMKEQIHTSVRKKRHRKRKHFSESDGQIQNEKKIKLNSISTGAEEMQIKVEGDIKTDPGSNISKEKCISDTNPAGQKIFKPKLKQITEKNQIKNTKVNKKRHMDLKTTLQMDNPENVLNKSVNMRRKPRWCRKKRKQNLLKGAAKGNKKNLEKRMEHSEPIKYKPLQNKQLSTIQGGVKKRKERRRRLLKM